MSVFAFEQAGNVRAIVGDNESTFGIVRRLKIGWERLNNPLIFNDACMSSRVEIFLRCVNVFGYDPFWALWNTPGFSKQTEA